VSAVPVIDSDRHVVGLVSEGDLLLKEERPAAHVLDRHGDAAKARARTAAELMSEPALTVRPDATLTEAARQMHRYQVKRLPVVDPNGSLMGIVSRADLLMAFVRSDDSLAREEEVITREMRSRRGVGRRSGRGGPARGRGRDPQPREHTVPAGWASGRHGGGR
jgi:CBS-domain-containing membrane protein